MKCILTLSELATLQISLLGIMVSVLSLVFAVVVGKRDEQRTLKYESSTTAANRRIALTRGIDRLSKFCKQIITVIVVLVILYFASLFASCIECSCYHDTLCIADMLVTMAIVIWIGLLSFKVWKDINRE